MLGDRDGVEAKPDWAMLEMPSAALVSPRSKMHAILLAGCDIFDVLAVCSFVESLSARQAALV